VDCDDGVAAKSILLENLLLGRSNGSHETARNDFGGANTSEETRKLSKVYSAIQQRCENPSNRAYAMYGGRGISLELKPFWTFYDYVISLPGYEEGKELDRIDPEKGYCRGNLQWLNKFEHMSKDGIWKPTQYGGVVYASFADFWRENVKGVGYSRARRMYNNGATLEELVRHEKTRTWNKTKPREKDRVGLVKRLEEPPICCEEFDW
jgi:hypothetical protein